MAKTFEITKKLVENRIYELQQEKEKNEKAEEEILNSMDELKHMKSLSEANYDELVWLAADLAEVYCKLKNVPAELEKLLAEYKWLGEAEQETFNSNCK